MVRGIHSCRPWLRAGLVCPSGHRFVGGPDDEEDEDEQEEPGSPRGVPITVGRRGRPTVQQVAEALIAEVESQLVVAVGAPVPQALGVSPVEAFLEARVRQWLEDTPDLTGSLVLAALLTAGFSLLAVAGMTQLGRRVGLIDKHLSGALRRSVLTGPRSSGFRGSASARGSGGGFFVNFSTRMKLLTTQRRKLEWDDLGPVGGVWPITEFQP